MKNGTFKKILSLALVVLMLLTAVFATGCKKKDKDKDEITLEAIKEKAEDAGYEVKYEKLDEADADGVVASVRIADPNAKSDYSGIATAYEFKDADSAKKAYEGAQEVLEMTNAMGTDTGAVVKRSDKIVILGADEIVKKVW